MLYFEKPLLLFRLENPTFEKEFRVEAYRGGDWKDLLLFILWYHVRISLFPALRDNVQKLDNLLQKSLYGVLKATEMGTALLVSLWKDNIPPIVEVFFEAPGQSWEWFFAL